MNNNQILSADKADYPEHEKLMNRKTEHKHIQSFCWFLQSNGLLYRREIYEDEEGDEQVTYWALKDNDIANLIAEYFGIDPVKLEKEKQQMLKILRKLIK